MKRRRVIQILAGTTLAGLSSCRETAKSSLSYRTIAFGTDVHFQVHGVSSAKLLELGELCRARLDEIETLFSLYQEDSSICQLNREGKLIGAPEEFLTLLKKALEYGETTNGLFDISIQPLWEWRERWKIASFSERRNLEKKEWKKILELVDYRKVRLENNSVFFDQKGMGISLNGIAQGYATDEIVKLLKSCGLQHTLVNIGEYAALGQDEEGKNWRVAIRSKGKQAVPARDLLDGQSLAVSAGSGYTFDPQGRYHHLFHPKTGSNQSAMRTIVVTAQSTTEADALSTSYAVASAEEALILEKVFPQATFESFE